VSALPWAILQWALAALPLVLVVTVAIARQKRRGIVAILAALLGAVLYVPARYFERWAQGMLADSGESAVGAAFDLFVVAPLHQGLGVLAFVPFPRRDLRRLETVGLAVAAGLGFTAAHDAVLFLDAPLGITHLPLRVAISIPAHAFFAAAWGYPVALDPEHHIRGRRFNVAWLVSTIFYGLFHHIVFRRSVQALFAAIPLLLAMGVIAVLVAPEVLGDRKRGRWTRRLPAPSIRAMTEALQYADRPIQPRWIAIGALVTSGVVTSLLAGAIATGRAMSLDFTAIDRPDAAGEATGPLLLLGGAVLTAFPVAGYLTTFASSARSVLEAAIAAALAIMALLVLMGVAAPFSVVFAVAFAPIAFGLACLGAWTAAGR